MFKLTDLSLRLRPALSAPPWVAALLLCFCLLILSPAVSIAMDDTPNRVFRHVLPDQLEALGSINDITQDAQAFMWFARANGLARYDGGIGLAKK